MKNPMKKLTVWIALLMAVIMLFSVSGLAEEETDPVFVTVNGTAVTRSETEGYMMSLYYGGYIDDFYDYRTVLDYIVKVTLLDENMKAEGYYALSDEETEALRAQSEQEKQDAIDYYVSYYLTEDTEEARAALVAEAEAYYAGYEEEILEGLLYEAAYDRWAAALEPAAVSEEELKVLFEQYAAEDEELFKDNVFTYEYYYCYYGYTPFYTPEGYRYVRRIVITVDDTLLSAWYDAQLAFEEGAEGENAEALKEARDAATAAVLASVQEKTAAVQSALAKGEDFVTVSDRCTEDADYVVGDENLIMIHADSLVYDTYFTQGVFGGELNTKGDVTGPFVTAEGVLFVMYVDDAPSGTIAMTDDVLALLRGELEESLMDDAMEAKLQEYIDRADVVYNEEAIAAAEADAGVLAE